MDVEKEEDEKGEGEESKQCGQRRLVLCAKIVMSEVSDRHEGSYTGCAYKEVR